MINNCILCQDSEVKSLGFINDYNKYANNAPVIEEGIRKAYELVQCTSCLLWWVKNVDENYNDIYTTDKYWYEYAKDIMGGMNIEERFENDIKYSKLRIPEIKRFITSGKVLEFGCSNGTMLKELKDSGYEAEGFEMNEPLCEIARKHSGCKVSTDSNDFKDESYDLVIALDVLEHLTNPLETVKMWISKLKVGGLWFGELPNSDDAYRGASLLEFGMVHPREHIFYYGAFQVGELLARFDCQVIESSNPWATDRLRVIAKRG